MADQFDVGTVVVHAEQLQVRGGKGVVGEEVVPVGVATVFCFFGYKFIPRNSSEYVGFIFPSSSRSLRGLWGENVEWDSATESRPLSMGRDNAPLLLRGVSARVRFSGPGDLMAKSATCLTRNNKWVRSIDND